MKYETDFFFLRFFWFFVKIRAIFLIENMKYVIPFLSLFLFSACVNTSPQNDDTSLVSSTEKTTTPASEFSQTSGPQKGDTIAKITTNQGVIAIRLFADQAPKTVENFVTLAQKEYYNGVIFHRVIPGFMIQGGDPTGTGRGGESAWGGKFEDEFSPDLSNIRGSVSMANAGPNTNGSQFFINDADNTFLNGKHSVFGQVFEGMDVVQKIINTPTVPGNNKPKEDMVMEKVEISKYK